MTQIGDDKYPVEVDRLEKDAAYLFKLFKLDAEDCEFWWDNFEDLGIHEIQASIYLAENHHRSAEDIANEKMWGDVFMFTGTLEEYAQDLITLTDPDLTSLVRDNIDYEAVGKELVRGGTVAEFGVGHDTYVVQYDG